MNRFVNVSKNVSSYEKLNQHEKNQDSTTSFRWKLTLLILKLIKINKCLINLSFKEVESARIIERCWCSFRYIKIRINNNYLLLY